MPMFAERSMISKAGLCPGFDKGVLEMEENQRRRTVTSSVKSGIGFGSALAMVISYVSWHSVGWAILHGIFGWLYVIYYVIKY